MIESDFVLFVGFFTEDLLEDKKVEVRRRLEEEGLWEEVLIFVTDMWLQGGLAEDQEAYFMHLVEGDVAANELVKLRCSQFVGKDHVGVFVDDIIQVRHLN